MLNLICSEYYMYLYAFASYTYFCTDQTLKNLSLLEERNWIYAFDLQSDKKVVEEPVKIQPSYPSSGPYGIVFCD